MIGREDRVFGRFGDMKVKVLVAQSCTTLCDPLDCTSIHGLLQAYQEYWSGFLFLPPGDVPSPLTDPGLLHCRQILYYLSHQGSS